MYVYTRDSFEQGLLDLADRICVEECLPANAQALFNAMKKSSLSFDGSRMQQMDIYNDVANGLKMCFWLLDQHVECVEANPRLSSNIVLNHSFEELSYLCEEEENYGLEVYADSLVKELFSHLDRLYIIKDKVINKKRSSVYQNKVRPF